MGVHTGTKRPAAVSPLGDAPNSRTGVGHTDARGQAIFPKDWASTQQIPTLGVLVIEAPARAVSGSGVGSSGTDDPAGQLDRKALVGIVQVDVKNLTDPGDTVDHGISVQP